MNTNYNTIVDYIDGTLNVDEIALFEHEISKNAVLKASVEDYEQIIDAIKLEGIQQELEKWQKELGIPTSREVSVVPEWQEELIFDSVEPFIPEWQQEAIILKESPKSLREVPQSDTPIQSVKNPTIPFYQSSWAKVVYAVAAVVAVCYISLGIWLSPSAVASRYITPYIAQKNADSFGAAGIDTEETQIAKGIEQYNNKEYNNTIASMQPHAPKYLQADFYIGLAYLANSQPQMASLSFERVEKLGLMYAEEASWYLALSYLKQGKKEEGTEQLQKIAKNNKHSYQQLAQQLLNTLSYSYF